MQSRKEFIQNCSTAFMGIYLLPGINSFIEQEGTIMTVNGPIPTSAMGFTLSHEHIMVDFIGADKISKDRYSSEEVIETALPFLRQIKERGCSTFIDCGPAYLGRDVQLLRRLSKETKLNIISNTGYYGAAKEKYLPKFVYSETASEIASHWIDEFKNGIEGTGIKPGFIKTGVDKAPLSAVLRKIIEAAAITHLATGLTIAVHTGDGKAANEQLEILKSSGVAASSRIWVHAQNETNEAMHIETAQLGSWVSFDGLNPTNIEKYAGYLKTMLREKLIDKILLSQDAGWYNIGEAKGGKFRNYNCVFDDFIPYLKQNGFKQSVIEQVFVINPVKAFAIKVRKL